MSAPIDDDKLVEIFERLKSSSSDKLAELLDIAGLDSLEDLQGADLTESNLSGQDFSGADFSRADLRYADLRNGKFRGANFSEADLSLVQAANADFERAIFRDADLTGADLSHANLVGALLAGSRLHNTKVHEIRINENAFEYANLRDVDVSSVFTSAATETMSNSLHNIKPVVLLSIVGHEGDGKTTLAAAIARVFVNQSRTDAHETLEPFDGSSGFALRDRSGLPLPFEYETATRHYIQLDLPGHADNIRDAIPGLARADGAILVVAATDGPLPQTREHILLARQLGVPSIVVFLNKCDLVEDQELLDLIELEVREVLKTYNYPGDTVAVIRGSALGAIAGSEEWKVKIQDLISAVDANIPIRFHDVSKPFVMGVESISSRADHGVFVSGIVERGTLRLGDMLDIVGFRPTQRAVVREISSFGRSIKLGRAGDWLKLLLEGVDPSQVERGQVICQPGSIVRQRRFKADVDISHTVEMLPETISPEFYFSHSQVAGEISFQAILDRKASGRRVSCEVTLERAIPLESGMTFIVEFGGTKVAGVVSALS